MPSARVAESASCDVLVAHLASPKIARADLSAICRAVGVTNPKDSAELHNLPLLIQVRCKKRIDTGDVVNEIKGYAKRQVPTPVAPPVQTAPANNATAPWKRA